MDESSAAGIKIQVCMKTIRQIILAVFPARENKLLGKINGGGLETATLGGKAPQVPSGSRAWAAVTHDHSPSRPLLLRYFYP
jgi:hypothetical protein